jgi:hypothetical protein
MTDTLVLDAIDTALSGPAFCGCDEHFTVAVHDDAAWLECPAFSRPSRLPAPLASFAHELLHERRLIVELPAQPPARVVTRARTPEPVTR